MDNFDDQVCKECIAVGEYTGDDPSQVAKLLGCNRTNEIQIRRAGTKYKIEIYQIVNRKTVKIIADGNVSLDSVYSLLMEILRFENLYEGIFFMFTSFKVDGAECIEKYRKVFLNYTHSNKQYVMLPMDFDDQAYKKLFLKSQKVIKKAWDVAVYSSIEHIYGYDYVTSCYKDNPQNSWKQIVDYMHEVYPEATDKQIRKILK